MLINLVVNNVIRQTDVWDQAMMPAFPVKTSTSKDHVWQLAKGMCNACLMFVIYIIQTLYNIEGAQFTCREGHRDF